MTVELRPAPVAAPRHASSLPVTTAKAARLDAEAHSDTSAAAGPALTFEGVLAAADVLASILPPTPSWAYPLLDEAAGRHTIVKHENVQPTGAFKVRGGLTLLATLPGDVRERGLITVSTGNHAQSLAFASRAHGVAATIVVPESTPQGKVDAVRALGAEVVIAGADMSAATDHAVGLASERGLSFVNPGEEPAIIHGHATVYLELLTAHPEIETLYVPVGSGSGAAGAVLVRDAIAPHVRVVGVQAEGARAGHDSWAAGEIVSRPIDTFAGGLATGKGFAAPQSVLRDGLDDFILVSDDQIRDAMTLLAGAAHTLAEGAGAASLAGALEGRRRGDTSVAGVAITGGNASSDEIAQLIRPLV